jgi:hypothetical protein
MGSAGTVIATIALAAYAFALFADARRGAGWDGRARWAMLAGAVIQTGGLALLYAGFVRAPGTFIDALVLASCAAAWLGVVLGRSGGLEVARAPLAALALAGGTLVSALPGAPSVAPLDMPWFPLHVGAAVLGATAVLGAAVVATRRLLRASSGGVGITVGALVLMLAAAALPWGDGGDRAFVPVVADGGAPLRAEVSLQERNGGEAYTRLLPVRVEAPGVGAARAAVAWACLAAALLVLVQAAVPGPVWRGAGLAGLAGAAVAILVLLVVVAWDLLLGGSVEVTSEELVGWLNRDVLPRLDVAVEARAARLVGEPPYGLALGSQPAAWVALVAAGPLALAAIARRARAVLAGDRAEAADLVGGRLERAELLLVLWGLWLWVGSLLTGAIWAELRFGAMLPPDPKVVLSVVVLGLLGLYLVAQRLLPERRALPSVFALAAGVLCLVAIIGPSLGWTLPSVHAFVP